MTASREAVIAFLRRETGFRGEIGADSDLTRDLGVDGDDFAALMAAFFELFEVKPEGYLWYFHHAEEGASPGALMFPPPDRRVRRIPVTPRLLTEAAQAGRWPVAYPAHRRPGPRLDVLATWAGLVAVIAAIVLAWIFF